MQYGVCNLSVVPLRAEASDTSEMVSQLVYGEHFKILDVRKKWSRIRLSYDDYEGWLDNKQFLEITKEDFKNLDTCDQQYSSELVDYITTPESGLLSICMGSHIHAASVLGHQFDGGFISEKRSKKHIINTAVLFLNCPYIWGGKTLFGLDCSGFTQMVYKINGHALLRDSDQQATQGESLSFIDESEPGDLAFFDNEEGVIIHVGIILEDHHIIHAHGKVRIDRLDQTGIFNYQVKKHTHKLRVIKRII
jgi:hypothetical protein